MRGVGLEARPAVGDLDAHVAVDALDDELDLVPVAGRHVTHGVRHELGDEQPRVAQRQLVDRVGERSSSRRAIGIESGLVGQLKGETRHVSG